MKRGFTLIELLVVVLIIGILASIALPQYTAAVEKSRVVEALNNAKMIEEQFKLYALSNPGQAAYFDDITSVDLSGGAWGATGDAHRYATKYFLYQGLNISNTGSVFIEITRSNNDYELVLSGNINSLEHQCITEETALGRKICKQLEGIGWEYKDQEL